LRKSLGGSGGRGARACVRACVRACMLACTRRLICPLLPNVNLYNSARRESRCVLLCCPRLPTRTGPTGPARPPAPSSHLLYLLGVHLPCCSLAAPSSVNWQQQLSLSPIFDTATYYPLLPLPTYSCCHRAPAAPVLLSSCYCLRATVFVLLSFRYCLFATVFVRLPFPYCLFPLAPPIFGKLPDDDDDAGPIVRVLLPVLPLLLLLSPSLPILMDPIDPLVTMFVMFMWPPVGVLCTWRPVPRNESVHLLTVHPLQDTLSQYTLSQYTLYSTTVHPLHSTPSPQYTLSQYTLYSTPVTCPQIHVSAPSPA
jgi:hypothetical protein